MMLLHVLWLHFALVSTVVDLTFAGICPSASGSTVDWWIVFQERASPFFHIYVDSTDNRNISYHFPERQRSVLSQVIEAIIGGSYPQYIVYSNDLINVKGLAAEMKFPTPLKWMHGILALDSNSANGFWLIHNNLYFPPTKGGEFVSPGDDLWYSTTVGDNSDNVFYTCLSLEGERQVSDAVKNILAGNPQILKGHIADMDIKNYFTSSQFVPTSTSPLGKSAFEVMECMYSNGSEALTKCIMSFASGRENALIITTRSRGLHKKGRGICYDDDVIDTKDFVSLTSSEQQKDEVYHMNTMFILSKNPVSAAYGVTCFGQDIAVNMDIVTIMICVKLPGLHSQLLKAAKMTNFHCTSKNTKSSLEKQPVSDHTKAEAVSFPSGGKSYQSQLSTSSAESVIQPRLLDNGNDASGTCKAKSCHEQDDEEEEHTGKSTWENPVLKLDKLSKMYRETAKSSSIHSSIHKKDGKNKNYKIHAVGKQRPVIKVRNDRDVERYLQNSNTSLLALFCQRGCKHCRRTEIEFQGMSNDFDPSVVQFLWVDAMLVSLPPALQVPVTPFIRFHDKQTREWTAHEGENKLFSILAFLHAQLNRNISRNGAKPLKRPTLQADTGAKLREKRRVHRKFIERHLVDGEGIPRENYFFQMFNKTIKQRFPISGQFTQSYLMSSSKETAAGTIDALVNKAFTFKDHFSGERVCEIQNRHCWQMENKQPDIYEQYYRCGFMLGDLVPGGKVVDVERNNGALSCFYMDSAKCIVFLGIGKVKGKAILEVNHFIMAKSGRNCPREICM